jgi:hypothetical protein
MNCSDFREPLHDLVDGTLTPAAVRALTTHLTTCPACRSELESLRALRRATAELPPQISPGRDLWPAIVGQLADTSLAAPISRPPRLVQWLAPFAIAATIAVLASVAERSVRGRSWQVAALAGTPRIDANPVATSGQFHRGQWLETDATARAEIAVGAIGRVNLEPNSRLRLLGTSTVDHRLQLAHGTLSAMIWAPPRLFFVETPSATAVDLGCAYTLKVDDAGNGTLQVEAGFVALEDRGRESIVPYRHLCLTRRGRGPGTPFALDAPEALRAALQRFDFSALADASVAATVAEIIALARPEDGVTLWHLLTRAPELQRPAVYDALAAGRPPPAGVTRAGILAGDVTMRHAWGTNLGLGTFARR